MKVFDILSIITLLQTLGRNILAVSSNLCAQIISFYL